MQRSSILSGIAVILLSLFVQCACAQDEIRFGNRKIGAGVSGHQGGSGHQGESAEGFWVIESNLATPEIVTVKFYEAGNRLIYEEHLVGVRMDVSKRRTRRRLDQSLRDAQALARVPAVWQQNERTLEDRGLVAARFR
jgi:hypothetical protein